MNGYLLSENVRWPRKELLDLIKQNISGSGRQKPPSHYDDDFNNLPSSRTVIVFYFFNSTTFSALGTLAQPKSD